MLEHLFGSKTRIRLLRLLFRAPERSFYVRQLTRELGSQINAIRRELAVLVTAELIVEGEAPNAKTSAPGGRSKKYYRLNTGSLLFSELQALLLKGHILGQQQFIADLQEKGGNIRLLVLTGAFTGEQNAQTDLFIVGDIKERTITKLIDDYEADFGCALRYTFMSEQEFYDRRHVMDKFVFSVFEGKHMKAVNLLHV